MNISNFPKLVLPDGNPIAFFKVAGMWQEEYQLLPERIKQMYEWDETTHSYKLPNEEWLRWRDHGPFYYDQSNPNYVSHALGGSDISTLFDGSVLSKKLTRYENQHGNDFKCVLELFHQKLGIEPEIAEEKNEDILQIGHIYEESVAQVFVMLYKKHHKSANVVMWNDQRMFRCGQKNPDGTLKYPFALADLDRLIKINGRTGVLEIKTTRYNSEVAQLFRKGICPLKYELQVRYYLAITNLPFAYICCSWGLDPNECAYVYIERDLALEKDIMALAAEFIRCLEEKKEPDWTGQNTTLVYKYLRRINGILDESKSSVEISSDKKYDALALYQIAQDTEDRETEQKEDDEQAQKILAGLLPYIGKATTATIQLNESQKIEIRLQSPDKRRAIDENRLLAEEPKIYNAYCNDFNTALFKKEQPVLYEKYKKQPVLSDSKALNYKISIKDIKK